MHTQRVTKQRRTCCELKLGQERERDEDPLEMYTTFKKKADDDDDDDDEVMLNVLRCQLTCWGQAVTNAEAWFNIALRPRKPEGSLGRTAQDDHLDSHTALELQKRKEKKKRFQNS